MNFDSKKFLNAQFTPSSEKVKVPSLKAFFDGGECVWEVRGLTGKELGKVNEAAEKNKNVSALLEGLISTSSKEKAASIKKLVGTVGDDAPQDIARRIEQLVLGSVDPVVDIEIALKLCEEMPVVFFELTNKITILTGKGSVLGKPKPSGSKKT